MNLESIGHDDGPQPLQLILQLLADQDVRLVAFGQKGIETCSFGRDQRNALVEWYREREGSSLVYLTLNPEPAGFATNRLGPLGLVHDLCRLLVKSPKETPQLGQQVVRRRPNGIADDLRSWWTQKLESGQVLPDAGWPVWVHRDLMLHDMRRVRDRATPHLLSSLLNYVSNGEIYTGQLERSIDLPDRHGEIRTVKRPYAFNLPSLSRCRRIWEQVDAKSDDQ